MIKPRHRPILNQSYNLPFIQAEAKLLFFMHLCYSTLEDIE